MFEPLAAQLLIGLYALMVMLEAAKKDASRQHGRGLWLNLLLFHSSGWFFSFLLLSTMPINKKTEHTISEPEANESWRSALG
jgi:hypothetical protein